MKYFIAVHAVYNANNQDTYGPAHSVYDFLIENKKEAYLFKHALYFNKDSYLVSPSKEVKYSVKQHNFFGASIKHFLLNIRAAKKIAEQEKLVYIGTDPINSLSGVLLKKRGYASKNIYFTADYADKRFGNPLVNFIYHTLDKICLRFADEVWCVSTRIVKKRIEQGKDSSKVKLVPNSPIINGKTEKFGPKDYSLVIVSNLSKSLNLPPILKALKEISKRNKQVTLKIIGSGEEEARYKKMVKQLGLDKNVKFLGQKNHEQVMASLNESFIGIALYTSENSWNIYGDSMKVREYVVCGLPVIVNDIPSTADDIRDYNAGLVLKKIEPDEIASFVIKCIDDNDFYKQLQMNLKKLSKDFDKQAILEKLLSV